VKDLEKRVREAVYKIDSTDDLVDEILRAVEPVVKDAVRAESARMSCELQEVIAKLHDDLAAAHEECERLRDEKASLIDCINTELRENSGSHLQADWNSGDLCETVKALVDRVRYKERWLASKRQEQAEARAEAADALIERIYQEMGDSMDKDGAWLSPRTYHDIETHRRSEFLVRRHAPFNAGTTAHQGPSEARHASEEAGDRIDTELDPGDIQARQPGRAFIATNCIDIAAKGGAGHYKMSDRIEDQHHDDGVRDMKQRIGTPAQPDEGIG